MTWSTWQVPPFITSVFFILGVFALYTVTFNWLSSGMKVWNVNVSDDTLNAWYGVIYMLIFVFSIQTAVIDTRLSWEFMNFQLIAVTFCAYFLNIHIPYYSFFPIVLVYMLFNHSIGYWQSWGHAMTLMVFFWVLNIVRVRYREHHFAFLIYMLVDTLFGGILWFWMVLKFNISLTTFVQEWIYLIIFEILLYIYIAMLSQDTAVKLRLKNRATHDTLTNTENFSAYTENMDDLFEKSQKERLPLTMMMFDIDHFKNVNDTYGHLAGDRVLRHVSMVVQTVLAENDVNIGFYRTGGEEFNLIFPSYELADSKVVIEQIFNAINHIEVHSDADLIDITISIGVCELTSDDKSPIDFYNRVDKSLYHSKQNGRMQITVG
ncbi:GGDEF domain-containing protein [Companilactobacillus allii]|uniref:GGDEF domain-containing protein n=1 Tax=Companilactobacillus allii TaxID=1847728 RepID=A0A1P8Q276_9LACO|nr:GGDEF domain-containing protein [Companilactobacillus allii]APX71936.1 GGDEF domain-containing protein [Companilactobacillus allii]USQ69030.1 GGDEF domain-containing protein [Companilactobacillus allii]